MHELSGKAWGGGGRLCGCYGRRFGAMCTAHLQQLRSTWGTRREEDCGMYGRLLTQRTQHTAAAVLGRRVSTAVLALSTALSCSRKKRPALTASSRFLPWPRAGSSSVTPGAACRLAHHDPTHRWAHGTHCTARNAPCPIGDRYRQHRAAGQQVSWALAPVDALASARLGLELPAGSSLGPRLPSCQSVPAGATRRPPVQHNCGC